MPFKTGIRDIIGLSRMRGCFSSTNTRHSLASACPRPTYGDSGWRVFGANMNITEKDKKRFWDRVDASGECWEWTAGKNSLGYGKISIDAKNVYAHRLAYILAYGFIPNGLFVCHHCDNPGCVKPSHLFVGTQSDNLKDAASKGRIPQGTIHWNSRLVENDIHEIRRLHSLGVSQPLLAKMWKICQPQVSKIVYRVQWRNI